MSSSYVLDIGQVAARSGLPASTLRYYEEKGLIRSVGRNGLRRVFDAAVLDQLALITLGRNANFSLDEIGAMLTGDSAGIDRDRLTRKADELDQMIKHFEKLRDGLRHAAACPETNQLDCPTFRRLLNLSVKNPQRKRGRGTGG